MPRDSGVKISPVEIQKFLKGVDFPASKQDLIQHAEDNSAPEEMLQFLGTTLPDKQYESPADVSKAIGGSD